MNKKIAIAVAALMIVALATPAVMAENVGYSATVTTPANVYIYFANGQFGTILAGTSTEITNSLTLTNSGTAAADVSARFTSNVGTTYGLVETTLTYVIEGTNFYIGTNGNEVPLNNVNVGYPNIPLGPSNQVPGLGSVNYDAALGVPTGQPPGVYTGNVELTYTSV